MEANQKLQKKKALVSGPPTSTQQHDTYMPPYLLINKNALLAAGDTNPKNASGIYKDAHNERAQR